MTVAKTSPVQLLPVTASIAFWDTKETALSLHCLSICCLCSMQRISSIINYCYHLPWQPLLAWTVIKTSTEVIFVSILTTGCIGTGNVSFPLSPIFFELQREVADDMFIIITSNNHCVAIKIDWWMLKLGLLFDPDLEVFSVVYMLSMVHSGLQGPLLKSPTSLPAPPHFIPPAEHLKPHSVELTLLFPQYSPSSVYMFSSEWAPSSPPHISLSSIVVQISDEMSLLLGSFCSFPLGWPMCFS